MKIQKRPQAIIDVTEIAEYYLDEAGVELAIRFIESVDEAVDLVKRSPHIGPLRKVSSDLELRMFPNPEFPRILIFYRLRPDIIEVVRVVHSARDYQRVFNEIEN